MNFDLKILNNTDLTVLYLSIRKELLNRNMSLKEHALKKHLTIKSHNATSTISKLSELKAQPINKQTRLIIGKQKSPFK